MDPKNCTPGKSTPSCGIPELAGDFTKNSKMSVLTSRSLTCKFMYMYTYIHMKAVGNRRRVIVVKCHLGPSVLLSKKTISSLIWQNPGVRTIHVIYAARRITLYFALESARGGHTNRHSECSPAQGFWPQRQLLLPERCSDLLEQEQKSVCGMLSWSPLTTSRSAPVPGTRFCSCTSGRLLRRPRCIDP